MNPGHSARNKGEIAAESVSHRPLAVLESAAHHSVGVTAPPKHRQPANRAREAHKAQPSDTKAATTDRTRSPRCNEPAKLLVLDTNALMHDPTSLFRFQEHDVFLPTIMLEELNTWV